MKRVWKVLAAVCLLTLWMWIFGCGSAFAGQKVTAMIQQSRYTDGLQAMIDKLEEEEDISVDLQVVPDEQVLSLMRMKLNAGEAPDLMDYNIPAIYDIVDPQRNFLDLSEETWVERLLKPENVTCKEDGRIYGFPLLSVPVVHGFIYNKEVFEQAGVQVPATWSELLSVCETLRERGVTPIFIPRDSWVPQILMTDNFVKALGADGAQDLANRLLANEAKWTDVPEFAKVIDTYLALFSAGYINEDFASATYEDAIEAVANGTAAMHFNGDSFAAAVLDVNPDAKLGMFVLSMKDGVDVASQNMSSPGFVVYRNSRNLEAAKRVLDLWSTPEYANLYFADRPGFPAFSGVDGGALPDYLKEISEQYISTGKVVPEWNYYVMQLNGLLENSLFIYYVDAPMKGDLDGAGILARFQGDYERYMQEQGAEGFG